MIIQHNVMSINSHRQLTVNNGNLSKNLEKLSSGYRINRALIEEMNVVPDFREPNNIRLGLTPLYTSYEDVWKTVERLRVIMQEGKHERYSNARSNVT